MIGGPGLALAFSGWNAMGVCFLLFFGVDPVFSAVCGAFAGRDIKKMWMLPMIVSALYLAGVWLFFEMGEPAFLIYGAAYLVIGVLSMLISALVNKRKR